VKVSIITAVFNRKNTISRCVESVLAQSYPNIEYIIVDGGSNDGTLDALASFKNGIDVFVSEKDHGIYDALNKGVTLASGDVIGFLHSDDFFAHCNVIDNIVTGFSDAVGVDLVYGDLTFFRPNDIDKVTRRYRSNFFRPWMMRFALQPAHPTVYVNRSFFQQVGMFNQQYRISADFDWLLRAFCIHRCKYKYIPQEMVRMQQGGASTAGIKALVQHNQEDLSILKSHGIVSGWILIVAKLVFKSIQVRI